MMVQTSYPLMSFYSAFYREFLRSWLSVCVLMVSLWILLFSHRIFANEPSCPNSFREILDVNEGLDELQLLFEWNKKLEQAADHDISLRDGVIFFKEEALASVKEGPVLDNAEKQPVPFKEVNFLFAKTGIYLPAKKGKIILSGSNFDGIMIFLPGIGFSISRAKSNFGVAGTFTNGDSPALRDTSGKFLKMLGVPMDAPLNGMGGHAPYSFGHPRSVTAVMRHVILVLKKLYPGLPVFVAGRSQGGLNALQYAADFGDVKGVIAVNPSSTHKAIIDSTIKLHEDMALAENLEKAKAEGFDTNFHIRSWTAHADYTHLYDFYSRDSKAPALILFGTKDTGYPQHLYAPWWRSWFNMDSEQREYQLFHAEHNLWKNKRNDPSSVYTSVVYEMAKFIHKSLKNQSSE